MKDDEHHYEDPRAGDSSAKSDEKASAEEIGMLRTYAEQRMKVGEMAKRMRRDETWIRHNALIYNIMLDF